MGKTKSEKGTKWLVVGDGAGLPLGVPLASATLAEVKLLEPAMATVQVPRGGPGRPRSKPQRLILDRGYDSDPLRRRLAARGIDLMYRAFIRVACLLVIARQY